VFCKNYQNGIFIYALRMTIQLLNNAILRY